MTEYKYQAAEPYRDRKQDKIRAQIQHKHSPLFGSNSQELLLGFGLFHLVWLKVENVFFIEDGFPCKELSCSLIQGGARRIGNHFGPLRPDTSFPHQRAGTLLPTARSRAKNRIHRRNDGSALLRELQQAAPDLRR